MIKMNWLLNFLKDLIIGIFSKVFKDMTTTPAEKTNVKKTSGIATDPNGDYYASFHRLHNGNKTKKSASPE